MTIERRVIRLEEMRPARPDPDVERMSTAELKAALIDSLRRTVDDPLASPEELERAQTMLALPWDKLGSEWSVAEAAVFCRDANRDL